MIAELTPSCIRGSWPAALSALFLLFGAGCSGGDGVSDYDRNLKKNEDASSAIRAAGGKITEFRHPKGNGWSVNLSGAQVTDELLGHLKTLGRVAELDLSKSTVTDDQLGQLNEQSVVFTKLDLSNTAVSDTGLDKLTNVPVLMNFNLTGTKVTPAGVERFKKARLANPNTLVKNTTIRLK